MCEPYVTANYAAVADFGSASENGGVGVDNAVITDIGVALYTLYGIAILVELEALCAEGNALIDLYVIADGGCFADDDTRAVVDEEAFADGCACVDIDAGFFVGEFGHQSCDVRDAADVYLVREAVDRDSIEAGI